MCKFIGGSHSCQGKNFKVPLNEYDDNGNCLLTEKEEKEFSFLFMNCCIINSVNFDVAANQETIKLLKSWKLKNDDIIVLLSCKLEDPFDDMAIIHWIKNRLKTERQAVSSWDTNPWSNFCDPHWELIYHKKLHPGTLEISTPPENSCRDTLPCAAWH